MPYLTNRSVYDSSGPIGLGKLLGKGGEGAVYEISGTKDRVAKIYHQAPSSEKVAKLEAMLELKNERLTSLAAWPLDILRFSTGTPVGFIMPNVAGHKDIHCLYSPCSRKIEFPSADWRFLIRAAANTARAFGAIHEVFCVIGDVNPGNVRVSDKATVRLVDCDSFQITTGSHRFLCEVAQPLFVPPELQGKSFQHGVLRSPNHDNFGLAVFIFYLLFLGKHPFAGRFLGQGDMSVEQAIREFRFPFGRNHATFEMEPPPNCPPISIASKPLESLMERSFSPAGAHENARPSPREWVTALERLETQLKTCNFNPSHQYFNGLRECPWCRYEEATGAVFFNFVFATNISSPDLQIGRDDLASLWERVRAVPNPGPAPQLAIWDNIAASPELVAQGQGRRRRMIVGYGLVISVFLALFLMKPEGSIIWMLGAFFAWKTVETWVASIVDVKKLRLAMTSAESHWRDMKAIWDREASDECYVKQLRQLEHEGDLLRELPKVRQRRRQELERNCERDQRRRYLECAEIEKAEIRGIGPGRKAMLASYNIESAWDINETHILGVPGFGPLLARRLLVWRQEVDAAFRFDPSKGIDPADIRAIEHEIYITRRNLERKLADGSRALLQAYNDILAKRRSLKPQLEEAGRNLAQTESNLNAALYTW